MALAFTPLGLVNVDSAAIQVNADSPYKTMAELIDAIRKNPGKLRHPAPPAAVPGICRCTACWPT